MNSIYNNLIQQGPKKRMEGSSGTLQIWSQCLVWAKREGVINRLCVFQSASSFWALCVTRQAEQRPGSNPRQAKKLLSGSCGKWETLSGVFLMNLCGEPVGEACVEKTNRQLIFGSRWGAALSTGAAQMPLKQSKHQLSRDTGTHWRLLTPSHPQPLHLLSHSTRVITHGTGWAHDGCWEKRTEIWHDFF